MDRIHQKNASVFDIMLEWYEAWNKNQEDESDPYGYPEWKLEYPHPSRKEWIERKKQRCLRYLKSDSAAYLE